ncbi:MAG TPA: M20/M25/M40 family metallo-hydrolase, partial [Blastocatellia bacterium]|nr:M20/M25/M40 family metallo-hydrolase [Blastocatellia bacterium]
MTGQGKALLSYFEESRAEIVEFIRWLVEQESMSREAEANRRLAENLAEKLASAGAEIELSNDPKFGSTLRARYNDAEEPGPQLLVVGHLDTVWPLGTLAQRPFRIENGRAFGPGIFDMKAGVAVAAFAMRAIKELGLKTQRPVTLLMTCDEET